MKGGVSAERRWGDVARGGCRSESDSKKIGPGAGGGSVPPRLRPILLQKSVVPL